jgi:hypothetical protein
VEVSLRRFHRGGVCAYTRDYFDINVIMTNIFGFFLHPRWLLPATGVTIKFPADEPACWSLPNRPDCEAPPTMELGIGLSGEPTYQPDIKLWRDRAQEARTQAEQMMDPVSR